MKELKQNKLKNKGLKRKKIKGLSNKLIANKPDIEKKVFLNAEVMLKERLIGKV